MRTIRHAGKHKVFLPSCISSTLYGKGTFFIIFAQKNSVVSLEIKGSAFKAVSVLYYLKVAYWNDLENTLKILCKPTNKHFINNKKLYFKVSLHVITIMITINYA